MKDKPGGIWAVVQDGTRWLRQCGAKLRERHAVRSWHPYSHLFFVGGGEQWVLGEESRELSAIASRIGVHVVERRSLPWATRQAVFYASREVLLADKWLNGSHHVGLMYLHGRPGGGEPTYDRTYEVLCQCHERIHRIQVTHGEMQTLVLSSGINPDKVFLIRLAVKLPYFPQQTEESRRAARAAYDIPESAFVVGSFQKDGVGWDEGLDPKMIKGPDVFLKTVEILKSRVPELFVLLTGPARGYVKSGLEHLGVPYRHFYPKDYSEIGDYFQALDLYIVASRQEGGPKAVLESMASGVPLVTTRVGQATELVKHGENGWLVDVEDAEGLAHWAEHVIAHRGSLDRVVRAARHTAEANSYEAQVPLWHNFMTGFVDLHGG